MRILYILANYDICHEIFINIKKIFDKLNLKHYYIIIRIEKFNPIDNLIFFSGVSNE